MWSLDKPFVIAEMSGNHNQSLNRALEIVDAAAAAGADAVKLQTYTADTMTMKGAHTITDKNSIWHGRELHDLYKEAHTPWEWHKEIFKRSTEKGILCFSSPFDETAVDFLEELKCPIYKIASFENTHHPLLAKVAITGKPIIMSTGVSNLEDIIESVKVLLSNGAKDITLLKCTSTYPASPENSNILTIPLLKQIFPNCKIGLSDHTMGIGVAVASIALGAVVVEKHFTLNRSDGGVDSSFSLEPHELKLLTEECQRAFLSLGKPQLSLGNAEAGNMFYKRSIYIAKPIKRGEKYNEQNLRIIRPGDGLAPKYWKDIIGKTALFDLLPGKPLTFKDIYGS